MALGTENKIFDQQQQQQHSSHAAAASSFARTHFRSIAPAPMMRSFGVAPYTKTRTSVYAAGTTLASNNPAVVRRNARERNRVKEVNNGFLHLRQHIPTAVIADLSNGRRGIGPGANKKLSKVDTLRMAVEYIRRLKRVIDDCDSSDTASLSSYNSCGSSSTSGSPPPTATSNFSNFYENQRHYPMSYANSFQLMQQQQQALMGSPTASTSSNASMYSLDSDLCENQQQQQKQHMQNDNDLSTSCATLQLKAECNYDDYDCHYAAPEDEDIIDYISLWQQEL